MFSAEGAFSADSTLPAIAEPPTGWRSPRRAARRWAEIRAIKTRIARDQAAAQYLAVASQAVSLVAALAGAAGKVVALTILAMLRGPWAT